MTLDLGQALGVLARTPGTLDALLAGASDDFVRRNEGGESFSPFDVVGHLIDGEETDWIPRARIILERRGTPFTPYDRFRHRTRNVGRSLASLLAEFTTLRAGTVATVRSWNLTPAELALTGMHPTFGAVTLEQLLSAWVVHDLGHVAQIARVMAKQYAAEVGPWTPFLPVLQDRTVQPG